MKRFTLHQVQLTGALLVALAAGGFTSCSSDKNEPEMPVTTGEKTPYVTRVLDYRPAVGQFTNQLPEYKEGDTQEDMNRKALEAIGNNKM